MSTDSIKELQSKYLSGLTNKLNICIVRGKDNTVYDSSGRPYLDMTGGSGENVLGYGHPALITAVTQQIEKLMCLGDTFYNELSDELASELTETSVFDKVKFDGGGAATLANAIKLINNYYASKGTKKKILVVSDSLDAISYGGAYEQRSHRQNQMLCFTPQNDFDKLRKNMTSDIGAVLLETLQPENGLTFTKHDFLLQAYTLCKTKGVLLIMNEFISGVGRTGNMFSYDYSGINPDIVLLSKGLGGGMPVSALLSRGEIAYSMPKSRDTFSTSLLPSLTAARVVIKELKGGLTERIVNIGNYLKAKLFKLSKYEFVKEIRGTGLIIGLELDTRVNAHDIIILMAKEGILASISIKNTIIFLPPYTITRQEIDTAIDVMTKIFSKIL